MADRRGALRSMAAALADLGHEVEIVTTARPDQAREAGRAQVFAPEPSSVATAWRISPDMARRLRQVVPRADLVVIHSLYLWHAWYVPRLCRAQGVPYVIRPHGTLDPWIRARRPFAKAILHAWFQDRTLREAAALHFTSQGEADKAVLPQRAAPGFVVPWALIRGFVHATERS